MVKKRVPKPVLGGPRDPPDPSLHPLYDLAIRWADGRHFDMNDLWPPVCRLFGSAVW